MPTACAPRPLPAKAPAPLRVLGMLLALAMALVGVVLVAPSAGAATGDVGYMDQSFSGTNLAPTSDKPQSKLWYTGGSWFADMFDTVSKTWHIFRLDRSTETWVDTGVQIDDRPNTLADALWDGTHLYVASHVVTISSDTGGAVASLPNSPARLYRYSYSSASNSFSLDAGFPTVITTQSSESMTIDEDTTGAIWATWTQVSGNSSSGFTNAVYVNESVAGATSWGTPFVLPVAGSAPAPDDISSVVAFQGKIGVLWSNQNDQSVYWAVHVDGQAASSWRGSYALHGNKQADDHMNIKALTSDPQGRVVAAVKTSLDDVSGEPSTAPQILVLVFKPGTGSWTVSTFGTLADCHTRPQVALDSQNSMIYVMATAPASGCPYSGMAGTIFMKSAPIDNPVFPAGRGTPIMTNAASPNLNDVTTTKQTVTSTTGLVAMASNTTTARYWHADIALGAGGPVPNVPVASFTETPSSGAAPLPVQFTDTSTGSPTSWAWDFGDGSTSTQQNPAHTYTAAGTYTVALTASNAAGPSAKVTETVTVNPAGPAVPTASFTLSPSSGTAPLPVQFTDTSTGSPTSWAWDFGDGSTSTQQNPAHTYTAAGTYTVALTASNAAGPSAKVTETVTVNPAGPAVPTASFTLSPSSGTAPLPVQFTDTSTGSPTSWAWNFGDGTTSTVQNPAHTYAAAGTYTATLTASNAAGTSTPASQTVTVNPAGPAAPTASFTLSPSSGTAPLPVQFTDTSTGSPTSWAWDFGDGSTSSVQNPAHTFASAGTYRVSLTASNAGGASAPVTQPVTVSPASSGSGTVTAGLGTSAAASLAATAVTVPVPGGLAAGDLLVMQVTADNTGTVSSAPSGWTSAFTPLPVGSAARVSVYYHVVTTPSAEPGSYTWTLSSAQRWGAVMGSFHGVDTANPFDTAVVTKTDTTYSATSLTLPGVTTTVAGAMVIGGIGLDSKTTGVTAPTGWTEAGNSVGGQVAELASQPRPAAGPTGSATWPFNVAAGGAGWEIGLHPAAGSGSGPVAPTAAFTMSPSSGTAPLTVQFTDASSGSPTSWAWTFGDGSTSTLQNPAHTFTTAGTYTVSLTASNAGGASAPMTQTVTVNPASSGSGTVTAGLGTSATASLAATAVTVPVPGGLVAGDVLIMQVTADMNPTIAAAPAGWSTAFAALSVGTQARVFVYYHVVANPSAEPASYTWTLSAAERWGAVMGAFHGVSTTNPFDTAVVTKTDTTYSAMSLTLPGVTTTVAGAMVIGGIGLDARTVGVSAPTGWTETGNSTGGQTAEMASQPRPTAGATGSATWPFAVAAGGTGWMIALHPAS